MHNTHINMYNYIRRIYIYMYMYTYVCIYIYIYTCIQTYALIQGDPLV